MNCLVLERACYCVYGAANWTLERKLSNCMPTRLLLGSSTPPNPFLSPQVFKWSDFPNVHFLPAMQKMILKDFRSCHVPSKMKEGPWGSCMPGGIEGARETAIESAKLRGPAGSLCNPSQERPDLDRVLAIVLIVLCF